MKIHFACPACERPARADCTGPGAWQCPACDHLLTWPARDAAEKGVSSCAVCGNAELYRKKSFPHWLGLSLLAAACLGFLVLQGLRQNLWAWALLLGSAVIDGLLYLGVGDVVVCYRCQAHHAFPSGAAGHKPFELAVAERYRQERIRREQLGGRNQAG